MTVTDIGSLTAHFSKYFLVQKIKKAESMKLQSFRKNKVMFLSLYCIPYISVLHNQQSKM